MWEKQTNINLKVNQSTAMEKMLFWANLNFYKQHKHMQNNLHQYTHLKDH